MPEMERRDASILRQLITDPEEGIQLLQQQYGGLIYRIIRRVLPEYPQDTEEVAADLLEDDRPLAPWLIVTARNRAIDRRRRLAKPTAQLSELMDMASTLPKIIKENISSMSMVGSSILPL